MSFDFRVAINQHVFIMQGANTVADIQSIGLIELSSVATGYQVEDVMIKAATVKLLLARSICSGKFLIAISGDVASVTTAIEAGGAAAGASLIERRQLSRVHPSVLQAISQSVEIDPKDLRSIGVIETFSAASIIDAADAAVKSANVTLLRVHLAMALGGKGFVMMAGDVSSVQAAVEAGSRAAAEEGMLVARGVIPAPSEELFRDYI
jgi:microcompartment protein CcmL/EutN